MLLKFSKCFHLFSGSHFRSFIQLPTSQNFQISQSTKKNKRIIEKPGKSTPLNENIEPETQISRKSLEPPIGIDTLNKENSNTEVKESKEPDIKLIMEELKTKRYKYTENEQKMVVVDLNQKSPEKHPPKQTEKETKNNQSTERLSKYLSRSGICSRREAEKLIQKGMIFVNNKKVDSNVPVSASSNIKIYTKEGSKVPLKENSKLWVFYKPRGLVCAEKDPENRPTVLEYLKEKTHLKIDHLISVGSMDFNCEGLLLITNDGGLARTLELPVNNLEKTYHIRVYGRFTPEKLLKIREGVVIKGKRYGPFWAEILNRQTSNTWLHVKMETGKVREIRIVMQKLDLRVNRIKRVGFGPYKIGKLIPGDIAEIEVAPQIKKLAFLDVKKKLHEHQLKMRERLDSNINEQPLVSSDQNKKRLNSNYQRNIKRTLQHKSNQMIEEK